jgi:hypothetical protein
MGPMSRFSVASFRASRSAAPPISGGSRQSTDGVLAVVLDARELSFCPDEGNASSQRGGECFTKAVHYHCARAEKSASVTALPLAAGSRVAIRNYATRNPWIELRDLEQEATVAALEAAQGWRSDRGSCPEQRESWIVALALSKLAREAISPVSLPDAPSVAWGAASSARRAPLRVPSEDGEERDNPALDHAAAEQFEPAEDRLDRARLMAEVRRILDAESEAARAVLLNEEKSSEVARQMGLSVRQVYDDTLRAMRAL